MFSSTKRNNLLFLFVQCIDGSHYRRFGGSYYVPMNPSDSPAINFFCECCRTHVWDISEGLHIPHPGNRYRSQSIVCLQCFENGSRFNGRGMEQESCSECIMRAWAWKKRMRLHSGAIMKEVVSQKCLMIVDLYVLICDYMVEPYSVVRMTMDHFNQQTLPKSIVLVLRRRKTAAQRRNVFLVSDDLDLLEVDNA